MLKEECSKLVSIIIPVYNGANYVAEAIESALAQTYKNIEVIVVNDGSRDQGATRRAVEPYLDRVRYFEKENGGVSSALNYGIEVMQGEYFSWLSHDDLYEREKIADQIELLNRVKKDKVIALTGTIYIDAAGKTINRYYNDIPEGMYSPEETIKEMLSKKTVNGCALLIPRQAFDSRRFNLEYKYIQDYLMWYQLCADGYSIVVDKRPLVKMRIHNQQVTTRHSNLFPEEICKSSLELCDLFFSVSPQLVRKYMFDCALNLNKEAACLCKSFLADKNQQRWTDEMGSQWFYAKGWVRNIIRKLYYRIVVNVNR